MAASGRRHDVLVVGAPHAGKTSLVGALFCGGGGGGIGERTVGYPLLAPPTRRPLPVEVKDALGERRVTVNVHERDIGALAANNVARRAPSSPLVVVLVLDVAELDWPPQALERVRAVRAATPDARLIVVAARCDLRSGGVAGDGTPRASMMLSTDELHAMARRVAALDAIETSAATGAGVADLRTAIAEHVLAGLREEASARRAPSSDHDDELAASAVAAAPPSSPTDDDRRRRRKSAASWLCCVR